MSTFTVSEPLPPGMEDDHRANRFTPDPFAPLPLGYREAVRRAIELRHRGSKWTWSVIAGVMGEYHGFWRCGDWWATECKAVDPTTARPRDGAFVRLAA